jgi:hypothetical protein
MQELKIEFDKVDLNGLDKPRQTRFLRSQQDLKGKSEEIIVPSTVAIEDTNSESELLFFLLIFRHPYMCILFSARRSRSI